MPPFVLIESYVGWHYARAYQDIFRVWMNLLWFVFNFFSIFTLLETLFAPWKRMDEEYPKGFDVFGWFSTLIINMLMRIVGVAVRMLIIFIGLLFASMIFMGGILILAVWTIMPIFLVLILSLGLYLLSHG